MFKAKKINKDSEQSNLDQYQHNNRRRKGHEAYQQSSQNFENVCKTPAVHFFVSFARENLLKQIENNKEKLNEAVSNKGKYFLYYKYKQK